MNKANIGIVLCCILCVVALTSMAQEQSLPVISLTYAADATLSQEKSVEAQIVQTYSGQETRGTVSLRLDDPSLDLGERALPQKSLRVEGDDMCFVLYNGGADARYTMVISAVCSSLITQGPIDVAVRAQEPVEVYLNGEYWGLYARQEDIVDAIIRFEALDDCSALNVADVKKDTIWGDASSFAETVRRIKGLNLAIEEDRQTLGSLLDTDSFLNWLAVNAYLGNGNLFAEIVFYQVDDGAWKCAMGDFAYALWSSNQNPFVSLHDDAEVRYDTTILADMMLEQSVYRDAFLTKLGALYQTFTTTVMQEVADTENARIAAALPAHMNRWAEEFYPVLAEAFAYPAKNAQEALLYQQHRMYRLRDQTLVKRPWYVYDLVQNELNVSDEDMVRYFGSSKPELPETNGVTWEDYKAAHLN